MENITRQRIITNDDNRFYLFCRSIIAMKITFLIYLILPLFSIPAFGESEDYIPPALGNIKEFAEVELTPDMSEQKTAQKMLEGMNNIDVDARTRLLAYGLVFPNGSQLRELIISMMNKLYVEGDASKFKVFISANPIPNASIDTEKKLIKIHLGLLGFIKNEDELAAVLAHELTHANPRHLKASSDEREIRKMLSQIKDYANLPPDQREEIRADLGALDRMINADYNPWASYDFQKRFTKFLHSNIDAKVQKYFFKFLFQKSFDYWEAHPSGEIRMTAAKSYIIYRASQEDLSDIVQGYRWFSPSIWIISRKMKLLQFPILNKWVQRGLYLYFGFRYIAKPLVGMIIDFRQLERQISIGKAFREVKYAIGDGAKSVGGFFADVQKGVFNFLKKIGIDIPAITDFVLDKMANLFNFGKVDVPDELGRNVDQAFELLKNIPDRNYTSVIAGLFAAYFARSFYKGFVITLKSEGEYKNLLKVRTELLQLELRMKKVFTLVSEGKKIEVEEILRVIETQKNLAVELVKSYNLNVLKYTQFLRYFDGLITVHHQLNRDISTFLNVAMEQIDRLPESERIKQLANLHHHLVKLPSNVLESSKVQKSVRRVTEHPLYAQALFSKNRAIKNDPLHNKMQLLSDYKKFSRETPSEDIFRALDYLTKNKFYDTAARVLKRQYNRLLRYVFLDGRLDEAAARRLSNINLELRTHGTKYYFSRDHQARKWDKKILRQRISAVVWPMESRMALQTYDLSVPKAKATWILPTVRFRILRYFINLGDHISIRAFFSNSFNSIREITKFVEVKLKGKNALLEEFANDLGTVILKNPELIKSQQDIDHLLANDYFWRAMPEHKNKMGSLEAGIFSVVQQQAKKFPTMWKYEPYFSEKLHKIIIDKMHEFDTYPIDYQEQMDLWFKLSDRGITSVTDALFEDLYERGNSAQKELLRDELYKGRVWEQDIKYAIIESDIKNLPAYNQLLEATDRNERLRLLKHVIKQIKDAYPEKGSSYIRFLENLSLAINSTPEESMLLEAAKVLTEGEKIEDFSLRIFSDVLNKSLKWRKKHQWNLILYVRGEIAATRKIRRAFRVMGPERVKRAYEVLPVMERVGLIDSFIDSPRGLAPSGGQGKWAGTIIDHIIRDGDEESQKITKQILDAFLYSLKKSGNKGAQSLVLSYLLAMPQGQYSIGETLKNVLEIFGTTGIKIGQFIAAAELLPEEENVYLRQLQEQAKIPLRESIYEDIRKIMGGRDLPVDLKELLGAASLKHASLAQELETGNPLVLKILRLDAMAHTRAEFNQLEIMAEYLVKKHGGQFGIFKNIVQASKQAVQRELSFESEVKRGIEARNYIYNDADKTAEIRFEVPKEVFVHERLIVAEFAEGKSIFDLSPEVRKVAARNILQFEASNLFSDNEEIYFDPDRHPGNYRIALADENTISIIHPIDFGQVLKITQAQRNQIFDLFALAQVAKETGGTKWMAGRIVDVMDLNAKQINPIMHALKRYFPSKDLSPVTAYYSMLSTLDDIGKPQEIVFFDYIKGIVQLNQYDSFFDEEELLTSPSKRLENIVKKRADQFVQEMDLTRGDQFRVATQRLHKMDLKEKIQCVIRAIHGQPIVGK